MKRAVRNIICLLASGLIVFGGMEAGFEFTRHRLGNAETKSGPYVIGSLLVLSGIVLLAASSSIAGRLTDDDDDQPPPPSLDG